MGHINLKVSGSSEPFYINVFDVVNNDTLIKQQAIPVSGETVQVTGLPGARTLRFVITDRIGKTVSGENIILPTQITCGLSNQFSFNVLGGDEDEVDIEILGNTVGTALNNNVEISAVPNGDPRVWNTWNLNTTPNYTLNLPRPGFTEIAIRDTDVNNQCIVSRVFDSTTQEFDSRQEER